MAIILRLPQVQARTGLSRSSIYNRIAAGEFPQQINLGDRAVGWLDTAIDQWIERRASAPYAPQGHPAAMAGLAAKRQAQREARA